MTGLWAALAATMGFVVSGCSLVLGFDDFEPAVAADSLGMPCNDVGECAGLSCVAARCRQPCERDSECGNDVCLEGRGCGLENERCTKPGDSCDNDALVCGLDGVCRAPCTTQCGGPDQECIQGACVGHDEASASEQGWFSCEARCDGSVLTTCNTEKPGENSSECATQELCAAGLSSGGCTQATCKEGQASCNDAGEVLLCTGGVLTRMLGPCDLCVETAAALEKDATLARCVDSCKATDNHCSGTDAYQCVAGSSAFSKVACAGAKAQCKPAGGCFALAVDASEVTRGAYADWLASAPVFEAAENCPKKSSYLPDAACLKQAGCSGGGAAACDESSPQTCVDWCDAASYCAAHGQRLCGRIGGGELSPEDATDPNLSEWHNACTSGGQQLFAVGDVSADARSSCQWGVNDGTLRSAAGGECHSTISGYASLVNLSGNAAEWEGACKQVGGTLLCTVRGGSADSANDSELKCTSVKQLPPTSHDPFVGFRCCG